MLLAGARGCRHEAAALAPLAPLSDTLVLPTAAPRSGSQGFTYGQVRGVGSAAFIVGTLLSGSAVSHSGIGAIVFLSAFLLVGTGAAAASAPLLPSGAAASLRPAARRGIGTLMRIASYRRLILVAALILGTHATHDVFAVIRTLRPSSRGELEITDVNRHYLEQKRLSCRFLEGYWTDAGTLESLATANQLVRAETPRY